MHGHRLLRQWIDRDQVSSIIEVDIHGTTSGTVSMSAWHTLRDKPHCGRGRAVRLADIAGTVHAPQPITERRTQPLADRQGHRHPTG